MRALTDPVTRKATIWQCRSMSTSAPLFFRAKTILKSIPYRDARHLIDFPALSLYFCQWMKNLSWSMTGCVPWMMTCWGSANWGLRSMSCDGQMLSAVSERAWKGTVSLCWHGCVCALLGELFPRPESIPSAILLGRGEYGEAHISEAGMGWLKKSTKPFSGPFHLMSSACIIVVYGRGISLFFGGLPGPF